MQYRKFGKMDWQVSALGLGTENLPEDIEKAAAMVRGAIDLGVNFIDIGWPLDKKRPHLSRVLQEGLGGGYREKVKICATVPSYNIKVAADFKHHVNELLRWLHEDNIDFLALGGLNRETWPNLESADILKQIDDLTAVGKIKNAGFFFHDQYRFLRDILEAYDGWSFAKFQYSFMDVNHHPGVSGLQLVAEKGVGVIVAGPLLSGRLVKKIPPEVAKLWKEAQPSRSPAEWALRWVWNHPEVSTIVSDMGSLQEVKGNAALADKAKAESFSVAEELAISRVRDAYQGRKPLPCTACRGCMPCPQGIDAPRVFEIYNDAMMYDDIATGKAIFQAEKHDIDRCDECGKCAEACGFHYPIPEWLKKARELEKDKK